MTDVTVEVVGLQHVIDGLDPARMGAGLKLGMLRAGQDIQREMRAKAAPHHFRGTLEQQIHVEQSGTGLHVETRVGITTAKAPEGRPLQFGWKSTGGKQPPTDALVPWVLEHMGGDLQNAKGQSLRYRTTDKNGKWRARNRAGAAQDAQVRSIAFLIARRIGRKGYSFGSTDWLHAGFEAARPRIAGHIRDAIRAVGEGA